MSDIKYKNIKLYGGCKIHAINKRIKVDSFKITSFESSEYFLTLCGRLVDDWEHTDEPVSCKVCLKKMKVKAMELEEAEG